MVRWESEKSFEIMGDRPQQTPWRRCTIPEDKESATAVEAVQIGSLYCPGDAQQWSTHPLLGRNAYGRADKSSLASSRRATSIARRKAQGAETSRKSRVVLLG